MHPHITSTIHNIFTYSQILFPIFMLTCQYGEACPRYLSPLLSAPLLSSKGRGRGRSKVGWCPGVNCFDTIFFLVSWEVEDVKVFTPKRKKQTISPCIDLLLPSPWHCRRYQGWGNCPDSWAFSVSAGRVGSGSSLLSPDDHEGNAPDDYFPHALHDHHGHVHDCNKPHDGQAYDGISHIH